MVKLNEFGLILQHIVLFVDLKNMLRRRRFGWNEVVIAEIEIYLVTAKTSPGRKLKPNRWSH